MSTREQRLLSGRQVVAKIVADDVKKFIGQVRDELEPQLEADEGVAAILPDGTRIGTTKRSKPSTSAVVTDDAALLAWVKEHRPDEIVESVSPAFLAHLKESCKRHGDAIYEATGEIVPGIELLTGSCSYLPQADDAAVPLVRSRLAELISGGLLALPSGETEAAS